MASAKKGKDNSIEFQLMATFGNLNKNLAESVDALGEIRGDLRRISSSFKQHVTNFSEINTLLKPIVDGGSLNRFKDALDKATAGIATTGGAGGGGSSGGDGDPSTPGGGGNEDERRINSEESLYFQISNNIRLYTTVNQAISTFSDKINTAIPALDMLSMIRSPIQQAGQALASLPSQIDSLRQNLLGMGTSLENFDVKFGSQVDSLVGDKFKNLENAATLFSQGFRGNNKGLLAVAAKMDLTGQKTSLLTNEFSRLSVLMQMNNAQMNMLASNLDKTSQTYSVKTEQLIQVIGKLKNLEVMSTLGFGGEFANNLKDLAGKYKMGEDQMIKLVNALTDPKAFQGLAKADPAIIGLVQQLEQATSPAQFEEVFKDIVMRLDTFAGTLAKQAQSGGLPATVLATQLFGMFGQDLMTASQLARVFTDRLSESEKQVLKDLDVTKSLFASLQALKTELAPVIKTIVDWGVTILKSSGATPIFVAAIVKVASSLAGSVTEFMILKQSIRRTQGSFDNLTNASNRLANAQNREQSQNQLLGAGGLFGTILKAVPFVGTAATVLSFIPTIISLFSQDKEKDTSNLQQISNNTSQLVAKAQTVKDITPKDSLYTVMARDMAYAITSRDQFNERMLAILTDQKRDTAKLDQLIQLGAQQLRAQIDSGKVFRRY